MKTIKINKAPKGRRLRTGEQLSDMSLYAGDYNGPTYVERKDKTDIRSTEPIVSKEESTAEAEKGELIIGKDLETLRTIGGKSHSKGGTPIAPDEGDYIVSNNVMYNPVIAEALNIEDDKGDKKSWAKVLKKKVDPETFNKYASTIKDHSVNKDVDPFLLTDAEIKLPELQSTVSRFALANELTKGMEGKPFELPKVGLPGLVDMKNTEMVKADPSFKPAPVKEREDFDPKFKDGGPVKKVRYLSKTSKEYRDKAKMYPRKGQGVSTIDYYKGTGPQSKLNKDFATEIIQAVSPYNANLTTFPEAQNYMFNSFPNLSHAMYTQGLLPPTNKGNKLYNNKDPKTYTKEEALQALSDGQPWMRAIDRGTLDFGNDTEAHNKWYDEHKSEFVWDKDDFASGKEVPYYYDKETNAWITPKVEDNQLIPINKPQVPVNIGSAPIPTPPVTPDTKKPLKKQKYKNTTEIPQFSVFDQLAFANAVGNKPKQYRPWAQKINPEYIDPVYDTTNYNPILSAQVSRGELLNQVSSPHAARYNMSYLPETIQGILQETARVHGNNLQIANNAEQMNTQIYNATDQYNIKVQEDLYNKNQMVNANYDTEKKLWKNDIFQTMNSAVNNRDRMTALQSQYPQFKFDPVTGATIFVGNNNPLSSSSPKTEWDMLMEKYNSIKDPEEKELFRQKYFGKEKSTKK